MIDTTAGDASHETAPDDTADAGTSQGTPSVEELQAQLDEWKGHARKHEDRAKDSHARVAKLEQELAAARTAAATAVREVLIEAHKLDDKAATLVTATTVDGVKEQVAAIAALRGTAGASAPLEGARPTIDRTADGGTFGATLGRALREQDYLDY